MSKVNNFNYFCTKLIERYDNLWLSYVYKNKNERFGRLWVMKMLFFAVVSSNHLTRNLLTTFDKWYALPNGPVEVDCYEYIRSLENNSLDENCISFEVRLLESRLDFTQPEANISLSIDEAISSIPKIIFTKNTFELVEISHRYPSWKENFNNAVRDWSRSKHIDNADIMKESIIDAIF